MAKQIFKSIRGLIGDGKIEEAIDKLQAHYLESDYNDESILHLKARYANLKKSRIQGIISREDSNLEENKIIHAILSEIDSAKTSPEAKRKKSKLVLGLTAVGVLVASIFVVRFVINNNHYRNIKSNLETAIISIDTLQEISKRLAPAREDFCNEVEGAQMVLQNLNSSFGAVDKDLTSTISDIHYSLIKAPKYDIILDTVVALIPLTDEVKRNRSNYPSSCYDTTIVELITKEVSEHSRNMANQVQGEVVDTLVSTYMVCPGPKSNAKSSDTNEWLTKTWKPYLLSDYLDELDNNLDVKTSFYERTPDCNSNAFYKDRNRIHMAFSQLKDNLLMVNKTLQK